MSVEREPKFQTPAPASPCAGAQWPAWSCCEKFESTRIELLRHARMPPDRHLTGGWNKFDRIGRWVECNRTVLTQNSPSASALLTTATYQPFWRLSCSCQNRTEHQTSANVC